MAIMEAEFIFPGSVTDERTSGIGDVRVLLTTDGEVVTMRNMVPALLSLTPDGWRQLAAKADALTLKANEAWKSLGAWDGVLRFSEEGGRDGD